METAYVHTLKTNANRMTTDFKGDNPMPGIGFGLFRTVKGLVSGGTC